MLDDAQGVVDEHRAVQGGLRAPHGGHAQLVHGDVQDGLPLLDVRPDTLHALHLAELSLHTARTIHGISRGEAEGREKAR